MLTLTRIPGIQDTRDIFSSVVAGLLSGKLAAGLVAGGGMTNVGTLVLQTKAIRRFVITE